MAQKKKYKYLIGIDEAGRGPLAGPVAVGGFLACHRSPTSILESKSDFDALLGIKDSKKLNAKQREKWCVKFKSAENIKSVAVFIGQKTIDEKGISYAVKLGIERIIRKLQKETSINPQNCFIVLDGLLKAPKAYNQQTIIKGDEKIPVISAASIIAKVARDKRMVNFHKKFPQYGFDRHKGYGTKLHYEKIRAHGLCLLHRRSYCKRILN